MNLQNLWKMKRIGMLLMFVLINNLLADAQEKYHFTINSKQDTVVVYDVHDNAVLLYGKDAFVYRQTPIKITKDKKKIVFSSPDKELGRASSKKYRKFYMADGSMYELASGKKKLSYKKDGHISAASSYSFNDRDEKIDVEMNVEAADQDFLPFLFQGVLAHIQGTKEAEQLLWMSLLLF
ncbi:MAG: hypothetical protein LBF62_09505 [Tannerellaceae bacterium]|jgi:hypothetical protein|nr:hypothetical protein [Tannerellaceae bacterium]